MKQFVFFLISFFVVMQLVAQSETLTKSNNRFIPDLDTQYTDITFTNIPSGSTITNITYDVGFNHQRPNDLSARISTNWNGTSTPTDLVFSANTQGNTSGDFSVTGSSSAFDGENPNQTFYLRVWDNASGNTGLIDYLTVTVYYTSPSLTITAPTENSTSVYKGQNYQIQWSYNGSENVKIEYFYGGSSTTITSSTSNDGAYNWSVPTNIPSTTQIMLRVRSVNDISIRDDVNFFIQAGCQPPTTSSTIANGVDGMIIRWNRIPEASSGYTVQYRITGTSSWTRENVSQVSTGNTPELYLYDLPSATDYQYRIYSKCSSSTTSDPSVVFTFTSRFICGAPTGLYSYGIDENQASIQWDSVQGADSYTVEYKLQSETWSQAQTINAINRFTTFMGLSSGTNYEARVKTNGANCTNDYSNVSFTTTTATSFLTITPIAVNQSSDSGTLNIQVSSNISWTVSENLSWLSTSASSGTNNDSFNIIINENTSTNSRNGTVTVQGSGITRQVTVNQGGANNNPTVTLTSPNNETFTVGNTMNITWSSTEQHHYGLYLYKGDETNQIATINLESVSTATSFSWEIPTEIEGYTLAGTDYKIKIAVWNSDGQSIGDYSNQFITINAQTANCTYSDTNDLTTEELDAISFLCDEGLLENDDTVEPNDQIQRSALAKLGYLSIDLQVNPMADDYPSPSMDLQDESVWYYSYAKNLIYLEYGDGIAPFDNDNFFFYPSKPITKAHALKVLLETWNVPIQSGTSYPYTDISTNSADYDYKYMQTAYNKGIISNTTDNLFHPNDEVLRKDVFVWLYRMMNDSSIPFPTPTENDFFLTGNYTPYTFSNYSEMHSGNFNFYTEASFNISGIGIPLDFAFTYNSYATEITSDLYPIKPMGFGWTHTYNSYIVEVFKEYPNNPANRSAVVHFPTGELNVYDHIGNNVYDVVTQGVYDVLDKVNNTKYRLRTKNQIIYTYEKLSTVPSFPFVLTSITDRNNNTLTIQYGLAEASSGYQRIKKVIGTSGRELNFTYYAGSDLLKTVSDPIGRNVTFDYDGKNFSYLDQPDLVSYTNPRGNETTYNYGNTEWERHLLKTITLPLNNTITNTYQNKKLLSSQTNGNQPTDYNITPNYGQTANNNFIETTITNPNNNETVTLQYNKDGNAHFIDKDNTTTSSIIYHATQKNLPISITTNGRITTISYDNKGNVETINRPLGVSHTYTYTGFNDVETYTDPKSNTYNYNYVNGNIDNIVTPRGTTNFGVNSRGLITSITDPTGIQTTFTHNSYGNVLSTNTTGNINTRATYDDASRLQTFTNPNNKTIVYQLDANDNLERETFNGRITRYEFDSNDNLDKIINARNRPTVLNYDNEDLLTSVVFEGITDAYTYLIDGKIDTYTNPKTDVFTYNYNSNNGRLQSVTSGSDFVTYDYESNTNNIETVTNNNGAINYTFDELNRVKSTTDYYGNTIQYDYDLNSNVEKITYPDGKEVDYTHYPDNLLHTVTDWNDQTTTYTYRDDGLLLTTTYPNGTYETITYDTTGRPNSLSWKKANGTVINEYTFISDDNSNYTTENKTEQLTPTVLPNENTSYTHNNLNRLLTAGSDSFGYDDNGNTLTGTGNTYTWDKYDRLIAVTGNFNAQYEYDGNGDRRKSVKNGTTTKFVLDVLGLSKVLVETDNSNNAQNYYVYGLGLISRTNNSNNTRYFHYDYRGTTIAMTDESEAITHKYEYSDFGEVLQADEEDYNQFRYVGKYGIQYETENLAFMRARYYNPVVGRFLTEDPIWSTNLFPYAGNNPINFIDVSGENPIVPILAFYAAAAVDKYFNPDADRPWDEPIRLIEDIAMSRVGMAPPTARSNNRTLNQVGRNSRTINATKEVANISKSVHLGQQGKHILGHKNFEAGRSILSSNPQKLLDGYHAGKFKTLRKFSNKVIVDFGSNIGAFYKGGNYVGSTRFGTIHSGKSGVHIVPANPFQF